MESIGIVIRDLTRQFLAFAFPGVILLLSFAHSVWGLKSFLPLIKDNLLFFLFIGYGASVAIGFAIHCASVYFFFQRSDKDRDEFFRWIGNREAEFQVYATPQAKNYHTRLQAYWELCTSMGLAAILGLALLFFGWAWGPKAAIGLACVEGVTILFSLFFGHSYMQVLVNAYEERVITECKRARASRPDAALVELLSFKVPLAQRAAWLAQDKQVWTSFLSAQRGFLSKEVLLSDEDDLTVHVVIRWASRADLERISDEQIARLNQDMGEHFVPPSIRLLDVSSGVRFAPPAPAPQA